MKKYLQVYGQTANYLAGIHETYAFTVSLISSFIICLNRFIVIFLPPVFKRKIFNVKATYFYALSTWFLGAFWPVAELYRTPCHLVFDEIEFTFKLICPDPKSFTMKLNMIFAFSFLSFMGFLYAISLIKLRWGSRRIHDAGTQSRGARRNARIFIQSFGVWLSILLNVLGFNFVVYFKNEILIGTSFLVLVLCPAYGSCTVILIFNHDVRKVLRSMMAFKSVSAFFVAKSSNLTSLSYEVTIARPRQLGGKIYSKFSVAKTFVLSFEIVGRRDCDVKSTIFIPFDDEKRRLKPSTSSATTTTTSDDLTDDDDLHEVEGDW
uniref:7TM GPCR serpentine receptor class x (Srx) domain-containing protein n=1 Tax=Romanomermis culicivorax TaxID=13658 RepID=A0A915J764_ROMCU